MSSPLDGNGVAAAREAIRYLSHPETPWSDEQVGVVINAYFAAAKTAEERKRRAAGPSSVKWPMPDPLAKYRAPAPSQTPGEPVAYMDSVGLSSPPVRFHKDMRDNPGKYGLTPLVPLSTLTAQAAALVAAEAREQALWDRPDMRDPAPDEDIDAWISNIHYRGEWVVPGVLFRLVERVRAAAESEVATLKARIAELEAAGQRIVPYLDFTVGPESPGYQPTMPSAVDAFKAAFARRLTHQEKNNG